MYRSFLRPILVLFGLIALGSYAVIMLRGPQGLTALQAKQRQVRELEETNATLQKQIDEKQERIEKLKHDPGTQERVVRERTGKTRPGDTSFVVPDQPTTNPTATH